jgi:hypothetical protein
MSPKKKDDEPKVEITSINQSGGITAHTVNVHGLGQAELRPGRRVVKNEKTPKGFLTKWELQVEAAFAIPKLGVVVRAPGVLSVDLLPVQGGFVVRDTIETDDGRLGAILHNARGSLYLWVTTAQPVDHFEIEADAVP